MVETQQKKHLAASRAPVSRPPASVGAATTPSKRRLRASVEPLILLVEDDDDTRDAVRLLLEGEGYDVEEATNGQDALERLRRDPLPSLVLLDLMMPVMSGETLLIEIAARPELASLAIVVTTASAVNLATSALEVPLLRKPLDEEALLRVVGQYAPRLWDDDEPATDETSTLPE